ncbi:MAG: manganese efflux pump MntP family protein [Anaerolineaceae bacterium]|nr:manganese efflux pump MntP family protein [Anaerolineaceae bacterium]
MDYLFISVISIGLAMDVMAVSLGIGTSDQIETTRGKFRLSFHFCIFQSGMAAIGWLAGETIVRYIEGIDHWVAFILLAFVGIKLIRSGFEENGKAFNQDPSTGKTLVLLSIATSIDAFAVGLSISFLKVPIAMSILLIGLTSLILSLFGLFTGIHLGKKFGKRMEIFGGLILLIIGLRVVISHLAI